MLYEAPSDLLWQDFSIEYVGEGAANVVFRLLQIPPISLVKKVNDSELPLLRLRKDLSTVSSVADAHLNYQQMILPHLHPDHLVVSSLAVLPPTLLARCNACLHDMEEAGIRPKKRRNQFLAHQPFANLVQDMSARKPGDTVIEFKPKWLAQSPSAPESSKRCRTCALRAMRQSSSPDAGSNDAFCPLDLSYGDAARVNKILTKQLRHHWKPQRPASRIEATANAASKQFARSQVIENIKLLQIQMDPHGILQSAVDEKLLMAMTLRDCTMFIRVNEDDHVEIRLGDIDLKPATKLSYWRSIEERLIDEGWYTCEESDGPRSEEVCALSRR